MSFKTAIRAKFRRTESGDSFVDNDVPGDKKKLSSTKKPSTDSRDSILEGLSSMIVAPETDDKDELRVFYDSYIKELQTQLLQSTIENENLSEEVKELRNKHRTDELEREIQTEKLRYEKLLMKLKELEESPHRSALRGMKIRRPNELDIPSSSQPDELETVLEKECDEVDLLTSSSPAAKQFIFSLWAWLAEFLRDIQQADDSPPYDADPMDEPLSPKRLKENITRLGRAMTPIWETIAGARAIATWRWPSYTCFVFILYMYALWSGWLLPAVLTAIILRLTINYLKFRRGWPIDLHYVRMYEVEDEQRSQDTGVAVQFNFIVHVARKCQNMSGIIADHMEKLKNLLTWQKPDITSKLSQVILIALILSLVLSVDRLFFLVGVYLGIKLFIIDCFFMRFPRLRRKYDSVYNAWQNLPTDAQLSSYSSTTKIEKYILPASDMTPDLPSSSSFDASNVSPDDKTFCEIFSLPVTECPLPSWKTGKRCAILNKDKSLANAFKHGKLYLTRSFLCFERGKEKERRSKKHVVIPLAQIKSVEKVKPFSWLPGSGMTISVTVAGLAKPLLFGVLMNRDDIYDGLMKAGRSAKMHWADGVDGAAVEVEVDPVLVEALNAALVDDSDSE